MAERKKVMLITGASGGIGANLARELASDGYLVGLHYFSRRTEVERLGQELAKQGLEYCICHADITKEQDVEEMLHELTNAYGGVDILINNAGINTNQVVWKLDFEKWMDVLNVNLTGQFLCIKKVLPYMRSNNFGRIVNITSVVAQTGVFGTAAYAASKAGVIGLTKSVAKEVANKNITVNAIALGYFNTGMIEQVPEDIQRELKTTIPKGTFGDPIELVNCIRYLISEKTTYITGQTININGGLFS